MGRVFNELKNKAKIVPIDINEIDNHIFRKLFNEKISDEKILSLFFNADISDIKNKRIDLFFDILEEILITSK